MTATLLRDAATLLRQLAAEVRRRPHPGGFEDALHEVMHGESHQRWVNLVAALGLDLDLGPLNAYDEDSSLTHPACYAERARVWAARIGSPSLVAAHLVVLAATAEREFFFPSSRARVGGRAYLPIGGAL